MHLIMTFQALQFLAFASAYLQKTQFSCPSVLLCQKPVIHLFGKSAILTEHLANYVPEEAICTFINLKEENAHRSFFLIIV